MATAKIEPNKAATIIDSRHLKIIAVKKDQLKDSVVFVCFNEDKYGLFDLALLRRAVDEIDKIEPEGIYFSAVKDYTISLYDQKSTKNRDIVVTVGHNSISESVKQDDIEAEFKRAFPDAKSVTIVHHHADKIEV